jgi:hypothetical protein
LKRSFDPCRGGEEGLALVRVVVVAAVVVGGVACCFCVLFLLVVGERDRVERVRLLTDGCRFYLVLVVD